MSVALTAVVRHPRSLLALLGIPLSISCFNPSVSDPFTTSATPDPTTGTTDGPPPDTTGDSTAQPDSDDATAGATSNDTTADATSGGPAVCGNRIVEGDEECDDGPANGDTAACKADCTLAYCGDGNVWEGTEECDDADDDDADECPTTCRNATCGDGYLFPAMEECDDAGESAACDVDCTPSSCGDGVTNMLAGEECDDANGDDHDACPTTCRNATCGDGYLFPAMEQCDTDDLGNGSCMDFGLAGDLACNEQCTLDTTNCYAGCPNGGAFVNNLCWYLSAGCEATNVTCAAHGLTGVDGYINAVWDMPTMQAIADQSGWINGGDINCCVEFAWVQGGAIYTHNFGPQFYNWNGCYDIYPTVKACNPP
jgi:hypothetical protein